jgi:shikimate dehydrogenase
VHGTPDDVGTVDIVVNATSIGMGVRPEDPPVLPFDPDLLRPGQVVADLVYQPIRTGLLRAAEARGARTVNGVGMLLYQAAYAFELWTGVAAPVTAMRQAVLEHLG